MPEYRVWVTYTMRTKHIVEAKTQREAIELALDENSATRDPGELVDGSPRVKPRDIELIDRTISYFGETHETL